MASDGALTMSKRFDPGQLRHALVLQQPDYTPDADGGFTTTWSDVATMWAALKPVGADVQLRAGADEVDITHTIIIRHFAALKPNMRFQQGARTFTVLSVNDLDETRRYTIATTREDGA